MEECQRNETPPMKVEPAPLDDLPSKGQCSAVQLWKTALTVATHDHHDCGDLFQSTSSVYLPSTASTTNSVPSHGHLS